MNDKSYEDKVIRLFELLDPLKPPVLDGFSFERCKIVGPAVLWPMPADDQHVVFSRCRFNVDDPGALFWTNDCPAGFVGVVAVRGCSFVECELEGLAFGGNSAQIADLRTNFGY